METSGLPENEREQITQDRYPHLNHTTAPQPEREFSPAAGCISNFIAIILFLAALQFIPFAIFVIYLLGTLLKTLLQ